MADKFGNMICAGYTNSSDIMVTQNAFQPNLSGGIDAYFLQLNGAGDTLWSTYYGGTGTEGSLTTVESNMGVALDAGAHPGVH